MSLRQNIRWLIWPVILERTPTYKERDLETKPSRTHVTDAQSVGALTTQDVSAQSAESAEEITITLNANTETSVESHVSIVVSLTISAECVMLGRDDKVTLRGPKWMTKTGPVDDVIHWISHTERPASDRVAEWASRGLRMPNTATTTFTWIGTMIPKVTTMQPTETPELRPWRAKLIANSTVLMTNSTVSRRWYASSWKETDHQRGNRHKLRWWTRQHLQAQIKHHYDRVNTSWVPRCWLTRISRRDTYSIRTWRKCRHDTILLAIINMCICVSIKTTV